MLRRNYGASLTVVWRKFRTHDLSCHLWNWTQGMLQVRNFDASLMVVWKKYRTHDLSCPLWNWTQEMLQVIVVKIAGRHSLNYPPSFLVRSLVTLWYMVKWSKEWIQLIVLSGSARYPKCKISIDRFCQSILWKFHSRPYLYSKYYFTQVSVNRCRCRTTVCRVIVP